MKISVIDYHINNIFNVSQALRKIGAEVKVISTPEEVEGSSVLVLPGIGAFGAGMKALEEHKLKPALVRAVDRGAWVLGICLGMQLLFDEGQEFGVTKGLGLIPGNVVPIPVDDFDGRKRKVPNIGWCRISKPADGSHWEKSIFADIPEQSFVYYAHSFVVRPSDPTIVTATSNVDGFEFVAGVQYNRVMGIQFHPEKSASVGLDLLSHFAQRAKAS